MTQDSSKNDPKDNQQSSLIDAIRKKLTREEKRGLSTKPIVKLGKNDRVESAEPDESANDHRKIKPD